MVPNRATHHDYKIILYNLGKWQAYKLSSCPAVRTLDVVGANETASQFFTKLGLMVILIKKGEELYCPMAVLQIFQELKSI